MQGYIQLYRKHYIMSWNSNDVGKFFKVTIGTAAHSARNVLAKNAICYRSTGPHRYVRKLIQLEAWVESRWRRTPYLCAVISRRKLDTVIGCRRRPQFDTLANGNEGT